MACMFAVCGKMSMKVCSRAVSVLLLPPIIVGIDFAFLQVHSDALLNEVLYVFLLVEEIINGKAFLIR